MLFYLLLCNVLLIPLISSSGTTESKPQLSNITLTDSLRVNMSNETKVTLLSEGGSLLPGTPILALPKEKLPNFDPELGKSKVKTVVARKGVVYVEDDSTKPQEKTSSSTNEKSAVIPKTQEETDVSTKYLTNSTDKPTNPKANTTLINKLSSVVIAVNKTDVPLKPRVLNYDTLANMTVNSSPGTLITEQMLSSKKELKAYAKNANSHPGMIMPLVITILLVPMFAVLGYMALRRGQEAWKNRHYKRMDFLLDGMYND